MRPSYARTARAGVASAPGSLAVAKTKSSPCVWGHQKERASRCRYGVVSMFMHGAHTLPAVPLCLEFWVGCGGAVSALCWRAPPQNMLVCTHIGVDGVSVWCAVDRCANDRIRAVYSLPSCNQFVVYIKLSLSLCTLYLGLTAPPLLRRRDPSAARAGRTARRRACR